MNKRISLGAAFAFMFIVAAATFSLTMIFALSYFNRNSADLEQSREMYLKFTEVDSTVRENYGGTIDETLLMDSVAQGYMKGIDDKYGLYISAEEFKRLARNKEGEDVGIGAVLDISSEGYLAVTEVYPDSPAQVAGITAGDLIVKIDDVNITSDNAEHYYSSIQGAAGTKASLVVRKGSEDVLVDLTRRAVAVPSVYSHIVPDTDVGYVLIKQFNDNTADQFNRELRKVIEAGASCLIFDVRDNKGSSLTSAVRILDKLIPEGVIYSAVYKDGTSEIKEVSDANEIDLPMVVLTNSNTASAAELFAQDLKDFGKASTVGAATTGKGVILSRLKLSDSSAIELTTALLASNSGATFDGAGVKPDYDIPLDGDWTNLDENTDAQLKKALEVVMALRKVGETIQAETSQPEPQPQPQPEPAPAPSPAPEASSAPEVDESSAESGEESEGEEEESSSSEESSDPESSESEPESGESSEESSAESKP